jgi:transcriptional regulator with XRE-family HTH domain
MHRTHVRLIQNGERLPQVDTVIRLASALNVDPGELLQGVVWKPAKQAFYINGKRAPS